MAKLVVTFVLRTCERNTAKKTIILLMFYFRWRSDKVSLLPGHNGGSTQAAEVVYDSEGKLTLRYDMFNFFSTMLDVG